MCPGARLGVEAGERAVVAAAAAAAAAATAAAAAAAGAEQPPALASDLQTADMGSRGQQQSQHGYFQNTQEICVRCRL